MHITLTLPTHYREDFAKTRSPVISGDFTGYPIIVNSRRIVCVGDIVSRYCIASIRPNKLVLIVDGKTRRHVDEGLGIVDEAKRLGMNILRIENPPGTITLKSLKTICEAVRGEYGILLVVEGEEDMLALPAIACSREGNVVVYGIPGRGAAIVKANLHRVRDAQSRILYLKPKVTD